MSFHFEFLLQVKEDWFYDLLIQNSSGESLADNPDEFFYCNSTFGTENKGFDMLMKIFHDGHLVSGELGNWELVIR